MNMNRLIPYNNHQYVRPFRRLPDKYRKVSKRKLT